MADGTFPSVISGNQDLNAVDNVFYVQLSDGSTAITVTGTSLDVNLTNASIVVTATDLDIRDLSHTQDSVKVGDGTEFWSIDASGFGQIDIASQSLTAVKISKDANPNAETNPIFVQTVNTVTSGTEIHDFDQAVAIASDATSDHDYTTVGTIFRCTSIILSASGEAKFEIQKSDGSGNFITKAVIFLTGREADTKQINFSPAIEADEGIKIIRTNRANQAQDLYSTIIGNDIA